MQMGKLMFLSYSLRQGLISPIALLVPGFRNLSRDPERFLTDSALTSTMALNMPGMVWSLADTI